MNHVQNLLEKAAHAMPVGIVIKATFPLNSCSYWVTGRITRIDVNAQTMFLSIVGGQPGLPKQFRNVNNFSLNLSKVEQIEFTDL